MIANTLRNGTIRSICEALRTKSYIVIGATSFKTEKLEGPAITQISTALVKVHIAIAFQSRSLSVFTVESHVRIDKFSNVSEEQKCSQSDQHAYLLLLMISLTLFSLKY